MPKKRDHVESFASREGVMVSYAVWTDGQGAELVFEAPMQPARSLSLSPADIGAFVDLFEGMKEAVMRQFITAERASLEASLRAQIGGGE
jgi:hypothetical protein